MRIVAESEGAAERIIADVWRALERMKLPSPTITVRPQLPALVIELHFAQQNHEQRVRDEARFRR